MGDEYQRKKNNPYRLPDDLYMRIVYIIRGYDRRKEEYHTLLRDLPATHGIAIQSNSNTSDPTARKAIKLAIISDELEAVEQSVFLIPAEYRDGVFRNIAHGRGTWYPRNADASTYRRWKQKYIFFVAKRLKLI